MKIPAILLATVALAQEDYVAANVDYACLLYTSPSPRD